MELVTEWVKLWAGSKLSFEEGLEAAKELVADFEMSVKEQDL